MLGCCETDADHDSSSACRVHHDHRKLMDAIRPCRDSFISFFLCNDHPSVGRLPTALALPSQIDGFGPIAVPVLPPLPHISHVMPKLPLSLASVSNPRLPDLHPPHPTPVSRTLQLATRLNFAPSQHTYTRKSIMGPLTAIVLPLWLCANAFCHLLVI